MGGIPAAADNPTGSRGITDHLGEGYRSAAGVPVVKIPGCAPLGDNYTETVAALLLHLNGLAPLPELDDLGRPAWLFTETVHSGCNRLSYYERGVFATELDGNACLVELGCWGPIVQCNITERGVIDGAGGCMSMGGICIGCTMPGFPDRFSPLFERPVFPATAGPHRASGGFLRRLRSARAHRMPAPAGLAAGRPSSKRFYRPEASSSGVV